MMRRATSHLALLLLTLTATAYASVITPRQIHSDNDGWVLEHHLGNLSPYFTPPIPSGLSLGVPSGCHVSQVSLIHRHGSRGPISSEFPTIHNLSYFLGNHSSLLSSPARGSVPARFAFLQDASRRDLSNLVQDNLTAVGRRELFDHGVQMRLDYPEHNTTLFLAGEQDRVVESAQWFAAGYLGRGYNQTGKLEVISESKGVKSYITPMETCNHWTYSSGGDLVTEWGKVYLARIAKRLNAELAKVWPGFELSAELVHGMLYACAYEVATKGVQRGSDWCRVFASEQIDEFEYELDLLMRGAFGYGLPHQQGQVMGSLFISNLTQRLTQPDRFTEPNGQPRTMFLDFGHDTTIDLILTSLGLAYDSSYPPTGPVNAKRKWRTSNQVPFAAQMEWRKITCTGGHAKREMVQLHLNKVPFSLESLCNVDEFGGCKLDDFLSADKVVKANNVTIGDEAWVQACGM